MKTTKRTIPVLFYLSVMFGVALGVGATEIYIRSMDVIGPQMTIQGLQVVEPDANVEYRKMEEKVKEAKAAFERSELYWLTMNIYHEARGENDFGKLMVGLVTLDRQADGRWGDTIKEVVTSPAQFSWYNDGKSDIPEDVDAWEESKKVANFSKIVYKHIGHTLDITHYHNHTVNPDWAARMEKILVVGNHTFYKEALTN